VPTPFGELTFKPPEFPDRTADIRDFGAKEGGTVPAGGAIRAAVASIARAGGGRVEIPAGVWLTGPIHLESDVEIHLAKGAELRFSQDPADYLPVVFSRHEDVECMKYSAFIYADGKRNIAITGEGTLNGQGKPWWAWKTEKKAAEALLYAMGMKDVPVQERIFDGTDGRGLRPAFFQPMRCVNVLVEGVTFRYGAFWTITPTYCDSVIVRNVHIVTEGDEGDTPNGDGVNPSSSRNVLIDNCTFDTGDDCVAIKAGRDRDGLRVGKPTENIVVRNSRGFSGHGGIVIGSETSGGVRNVYAADCSFEGTDRMVRIKTARGRGGMIENMWFRNLAGTRILKEALHLNMLYTGTRLPAQPPGATTPAIRNITFENITVTAGQSWAIELLGLPERAIETVRFDGVTASAKRGIHVADARGVTFTGVALTLTAADSAAVLLDEARAATFDRLTADGPFGRLLQAEGAGSEAIVLRGTRVPPDGIKLGRGVKPAAVTVER
jgi:polygalacturonase